MNRTSRSYDRPSIKVVHKLLPLLFVLAIASIMFLNSKVTNVAAAPAKSEATSRKEANADSVTTAKNGDKAAKRRMAKLKSEIRALDAKINGKEREIFRFERSLEQIGDRIDGILVDYANRLSDLFESADTVELDALLAARTEQSPESLNELADQLSADDRALVERHISTLEAEEKLTERLEQAQTDLALLKETHTQKQAELKDNTTDKSAKKAKSIRADYVFTTGPIPSIGYWGEVTGGGILTGWTGLASAALGGVGCEAPDAELKATGEIEQGDASWYGPGFHGNSTASGEVYDQNAMTAAHKTLPFGTIVRVFAPTTGACTFVRINDRGPFVDGRIIDLSFQAAQTLGISGVEPVQIETWAA